MGYNLVPELNGRAHRSCVGYFDHRRVCADRKVSDAVPKIWSRSVQLCKNTKRMSGKANGGILKIQLLVLLVSLMV